MSKREQRGNLQDIRQSRKHGRSSLLRRGHERLPADNHPLPAGGELPQGARGPLQTDQHRHLLQVLADLLRAPAQRDGRPLDQTRHQPHSCQAPTLDVLLLPQRRAVQRGHEIPRALREPPGLRGPVDPQQSSVAVFATQAREAAWVCEGAQVGHGDSLRHVDAGEAVH